MLGFLKRIFCRQSRKVRGKKTEPGSELPSQAAAYPYALAALLFFGLQSLVATAGALDLVLPDLPVPVPFEVGRSLHLNLAIFWPLLGAMGLAYYFFVAEAGSDLKSPPLVRWQLYLFLFILLAILVTLTFKLTEGREYLEAIPPLDLGVVVVGLLFIYNLLATYLQPGVPRARPSLLAFLLSAVTLTAFYLPNLFFYAHATWDEMAKFWVVHLWEEGSLELMASAVLAGLILRTTGEGRRQVERALWFELFLVTISGIPATAHHYYWIGLPEFWLWLGGIFSGLQLVPILLLTVSGVRALDRIRWKQLDGGSKLALAMAAASVFYHLIGVGLLGFILALPFLNLYAHGTFLTSAHAHFALFGAFGLLVVAGCYYLLTRRLPLGKANERRGFAAVALLNLGLLLMGGSLALAGFLQTYLWRAAGLDFMWVQALVRPYLLLRAAGGGLFATGSILLLLTILPAAWRHRRFFLRGEE